MFIKNTKIENITNSIAIVFFLPISSIIYIVMNKPGNSAIVVYNKSM
jgi:hypothetical protein